MAYTSHGYLIPGSPETEPKPTIRARCGGPGRCAVCSEDARSYGWARDFSYAKNSGGVFDMMNPDYHFSRMRDLLDEYKPSMERSLAQMKLEECELWLSKCERTDEALNRDQSG